MIYNARSSHIYYAPKLLPMQELFSNRVP